MFSIKGGFLSHISWRMEQSNILHLRERGWINIIFGTRPRSGRWQGGVTVVSVDSFRENGYEVLEHCTAEVSSYSLVVNTKSNLNSLVGINEQGDRRA